MKPPSRRALAATTLVPAFLLAGVVPAHATADAPAPDSAPVVQGADPGEGREPAASSDRNEPGMLLAEPAGAERIMLEETERPVAPGLDLRSFQWLDSAGFMRGDVLTARLGTEGLSLDYVDGGSATSNGPLEEHVEEAGGVAGVNGDFFDINNSGSSHGVGLSQDGLRKGPNTGWHRAVGVDTEGLAQVTEMYLEGEIVLPGGRTAPLRGFNQNHLAVGEIGAYTSLWGAYTRDRATLGLTHKREVVVTDGVVTSVSTQPGEGVLPEGAVALVGREAGADALAGLEVGDEVAVSYGLRSTAGELDVAVGGNQHLVRDGQPVTHSDKTVHPRTAVGFTEDRETMFLVTIDGRMSASRGMSLDDLGDFMAELGAHTAINLDGGGSSTLVAREPGEAGVEVENEPSDGYPRPVPNGLALFAEEGSGRVTGMRLETESGTDEHLRRVFPGLTRELEALGHDETYAPVDAEPTYRATPGAVGTVDADGTFTARRSGDATVTASSKGARGELGLTVLGELARMRPTVTSLALKDVDDTASFGLVGYDADGFQAPVEPADVSLEYDADAIEVTADDAGGFTVAPVADAAGVVITATVGDVVTHVPVSVGLESRVVADFDDAASWRWSGARSSGSLEPTEGRDGGTALQINYDFTQSTATRTSNAASPEHIVIEGQPQTIGLWVRGDGRGQWWSFSVLDADGNYHPLYGPFIDWTGWRYVEVDVPQGIPFPMTVYRFGIIETAASEQYAGSVAIDDITVNVAPEVRAPAAEQVVDDVVVTDGAAVDGEDEYSFAVVSDAQFTASNQALVPAARRTLQEALAADPDFVVINGDWVDTAFPDDLALARKVIEEEIGDAVPWYYVPGNHEIYGPGDVAAFEAEFGPANQAFVHEGTQFVLLDSSTGTLLGGGFDQWQLLRDSLDAAAADEEITGLVVLSHMPPHDPSPVPVSQLANGIEVGVVEEWLADFRRSTGKGAAYIGSHVGSFSASSVDGVPYVINGNAGKAPSTDPADGGFSGWSLVGINPDARLAPLTARHRATPDAAAGEPWFEVEMRPHVDALELTAPADLAVGAEADVEAEVTQGSRTFPVAYPVSARWSSQTVHVGAVEDAKGHHLAAFDPETGTLTALRPGTADLTVTVNAVSETTTVTIG